MLRSLWSRLPPVRAAIRREVATALPLDGPQLAPGGSRRVLAALCHAHRSFDPDLLWAEIESQLRARRAWRDAFRASEGACPR